jgi:outer membrane protein OmpA-like peptidoglycan-associated protein
MNTKTQKILSVVGMVSLLGACATQPKDTAKLDAQIGEVTAEDFGQFVYHETLSEENLSEARTIRQWWKDGHYWNIDTEAHATAAAERALMHRQMAEKSLEAWHDRCVRHPDVCIKEELLAAAYFDTGSAEPRTINYETINHIVALSRIHHPLSVDVIGYTDTVGDTGSNKHLALHRAEAIHKLLHEHDIEAHTVVDNIPYGEAGGPDNLDEQANRRVDVKIHLYQPYPK